MKFLYLVCIIFLLFSCSKNEKVKENRLNIALTSEVSTIDPAISGNTISAEVINNVYEPLFQYKYLVRPYQLEPLLAASMPLSKNNGLEFLIKIKKNIQYHDDISFKGKKRFVKAKDFITQFKRIAFKGTRSNGWWIFDGKIQGLNEFREEAGTDIKKLYSSKVSGLKALDDHTLSIKLTRPYPQLLFALSLAYSAPIPLETLKYYKNEFVDVMVGTGPFKLKKWNQSLNIILDRYENYRTDFFPKNGDRYAFSKKLIIDAGKKIPFVDGITFHIIKEGQTRWLNFLKHKIDYMLLTKDHFAIALDQVGGLKKEFIDENIKLQISPTLTFWWLAFNMKSQIFVNNLNLRKSIAHAIDWEKYITRFTNKLALAANSLYPPGIPGYSPTNRLPYTYNIVKAKRYLEEAGFPNGKGLPIIKYNTRSSSTVSKQMAEFIRAELDKIGIKLEIIVNSFPRFLEKSRNGQLELWQGGWAMDYPDAENIIQLLISKNHAPGPNNTYYSNKKVDEYFQKLSILPENSIKKQYMKKIENEVLKDIPWAMSHYSRNYILIHSRLKNFRHSDLIYNIYKYLRLEE